MEEVHLPQSQVSLQEGKTFHTKFLSKRFCNINLNFLVSFNLILSALREGLHCENFLSEYFIKYSFRVISWNIKYFHEILLL